MYLRIRVCANDKTDRHNMQMGKVKKEEGKSSNNTKISLRQNVWLAACQRVSSRQYCVGIIEGARLDEESVRAWARWLLGFSYFNFLSAAWQHLFTVPYLECEEPSKSHPLILGPLKCLIQLDSLARCISVFI